MQIDNNTYPWLKSKGYLHVTPKINVTRNTNRLISQITNPSFIKNYSFYPLIHSSISERRYRKDEKQGNKRSHTHLKDGEMVQNTKDRPLHYATHFDALIFAYYAHLIGEQYKLEIDKHPNLSDCIIAYRKIPIHGEKKNKSTIHFAKEVFTEISTRASIAPVVVLTFDITSFFSHMAHDILLKKWIQLFGKDNKIPDDHFNVFKATTKFSYILKDDLRLYTSKKGKKGGFDEKHLADIRNIHGKQSFFASHEEFRKLLKSKQLRVYKHPFTNKITKRIRGIPQGLPISSVLANLYLLDFDLIMLQLTKDKGIYYRRYSDDIIVICDLKDADELVKTVRDVIQDECHVEISKSKTERFLFEMVNDDAGQQKLVSKKLVKDVFIDNLPLSYLGFDFYGHRTAIKKANISKFYRRMIVTVKRKCRYAVLQASKAPGTKPVVFRRQLYKLYTQQQLANKEFRKRFTSLIADGKGGFKVKTKPVDPKRKSNYFSYVRRAAYIMQDKGIEKQLRNHKNLLRSALLKHLQKELNKSHSE